MKILFLTNVPSPYRVAFFNELGKLCDLTVLFEKKTSSERDISWQHYQFDHFSGIFLKGLSISTDTAICFGVTKWLKQKKYDYIICSNISSPTGILAVWYMKRHGIKYYIEADGGTPKNGRGIKEWLKRKIIGHSSGCFSTGKENDKYFVFYGADEQNIYRYPFTSLYEKDLFTSTATDDEKTLLRQKLNIPEEKVIISVGRFSYLNGYGKGYDVLLKSAKQLPQNIGWYIIGGQPTSEFNKLLSQSGLNNFHFVDFKLKDELIKYYRASDLFVLMTVKEAWGLVVNEAMACGLPVITTDQCIAGTELVNDGENGFIVPVGGVEDLVSKVEVVINDKPKLLEMGCNSLHTIKQYTFENMAKEHIDIFNRVLNAK